MTGIPQFNFSAFDVAASTLRAMGYEVVSPAELDTPEDRALALASPDGRIETVVKSWGQFLARDVLLIADGDADGPIDGIFVLPGWDNSRGARLETFVGFLCRKPIYEMRAYALHRLSLLQLARGWLQKHDISFYTKEKEYVA